MSGDPTAAAGLFLTGLGQSLSALGLYREGHPAREKAVDLAYDRLVTLVADPGRLPFTFLDDEVLVGERRIAELRGWSWAPKLAAAGVQRLEFVSEPTREEFVAFLEDIHDRVAGHGPSSAESRPAATGPIRWGAVSVVATSIPADQAARTGPIRLEEEAGAVQWIHEALTSTGKLPLAEAEAVVRSLAVAMRGDQRLLVPLLRLRSFDEYTTTHSLNVSVLAMALAEHLELASADVRAFGVAGLLHDIGKVRIPKDILNKPGKLTEQEREVMNRHPLDGAAIILEHEDDLDLAAVVAYEHHIMIDGGGYPALHYPRQCHHGSHVVHVCDVYDALRTKRPYRDAWPAPKVLSYIEERAGTEFHPDIARAFLGMMAEWEAVEIGLGPDEGGG
ncbi:MAG: HD domain-containing phosphohydrolase [Gemmatimonadota bacterium]